MKFRIILNETTPKIEEFKSLSILLKEDFKLLTKFLRFARLQHNCTGLASNQVSVNKNRIMEPFFAIKHNHIWEMFIHPQIIAYHGKSNMKGEGCLTWLGKTIHAERYESIDVKYANLKGEYTTTTLKDYQAQVFQHEYDHLLGVKEKFFLVLKYE